MDEIDCHKNCRKLLSCIREYSGLGEIYNCFDIDERNVNVCRFDIFIQWRVNSESSGTSSISVENKYLYQKS